MAAKIAVTQKRLFANVFVCRNCESKLRADSKKVAEGKVRCRKCKNRHLRPVRKK